MSDLVEIRRVTVIAETTLQDVLIDLFERAGAKGYTCSPCTGHGRHGVVSDPYSGQALVKLEVLARTEIADTIMKRMHDPELRRYPTICVMDKVLADARDVFY